jgi:hypothetical protein
VALSPQTLYTWVFKGIIVPARSCLRGGGEDNVTTFDYKTALGIANAAGFQAVYEVVPTKAVRMLVGAMVRKSDQEHMLYFQTASREGVADMDGIALEGMEEAVAEAKWRRFAVAELFGIVPGETPKEEHEAE